MQVGDKGAVLPDGIQAGKQGRVFILAIESLVPCGEGTVLVEKREDGYHIDLAYVPDYRWKRFVGGKVYRVKSVANATCPPGS
jgi:hypothetical protein